MKVLITAPSLDENENVSGISTMVSSIIENAHCEFTHFTAGRKDGETVDPGWVGTQLKLPFAFRRAISRSKPDVVHINTAFEPKAMIRDTVIASCTGRTPTIVHVHGGRFVMDEPPNAALKRAAERMLRRATRVIVLSDAEREKILDRMPGLDVSILPNAVATSAYPDRERVWGEKTGVFLGRLDEAKGLSEIVEACRLLAGQGFKFKFSCYGTGQDQEEFFRRMRSVIGDDFHYGGVVSGVEKIKALEAADIFLMPSRFEGLSLALLEAMAAGCVPVVSNRGSIPSVVEDGRNGFLIDPGDITQIVGRIKYLLSEGERGWDEYRSHARETVRTRFDIDKYVRKLNEIYTEVSAAR